MKIIIFQFSGTGNTWFVARHLQRAFQELEGSCDVMSIESSIDVNTQIKDADIIGLGYPIYGSDLPEPVTSFIEKIAFQASKKAFVYCTQLMYSGDGAAIGAKALRRRGFIVRQLAHFNMPNNITDYRIVRWVKPRKPERLERIITRKTNRFAETIMKDKHVRKGEHLLGLFLGLLQRIPYRQGKTAWKKSLKIDSTCIGCKRCIELCPSGNLTMVENQAQASDKCYLCYRCINHCPVNAIHFAKKTRVIKPYHGPNIAFDIYDVRRDFRE